MPINKNAARTKSTKAALNGAAFVLATARTASYERMSQDATGLMLGHQRQRDENDELAKRYGVTISDHLRFVDTESAYKGRKHRAGFENLLSAMARGEIDVIIAWHIDRLYRSLKDFARFAEIAEENNIIVKTVTGGDLDFSTPTGKAIAAILTVIAEMESGHKGERQLLANKQRADAGKWQTTTRPFGYTMAGQPLEPEASAVRKAVVDIMRGASIRGIAREWNAAGFIGTRGQPFRSVTVRRMIVNPLYAALKTHNGEVVGEGQWEPLIDAETHAGLVALLSDPARVQTASFDRKYMGGGLYRCGRCAAAGVTDHKGQPITMTSCKPGNSKKRSGSTPRPRSYVCRKQAHLLRAGDPVDDYVTACLIEWVSRPDAHLMLENQGVDLADLGVQREGLIRRKDTARRMWRAGNLDDAEYEEDVAELTRQIAACDAALAAATRTSPAARLVRAGADGDDVYACWLDMTPTERAQVIDELATVTILPASKPGGGGFNPDDVVIAPRRGFSQNP